MPEESFEGQFELERELAGVEASALREACAGLSEAIQGYGFSARRLRREIAKAEAKGTSEHEFLRRCSHTIRRLVDESGAMRPQSVRGFLDAANTAFTSQHGHRATITPMDMLKEPDLDMERWDQFLADTIGARLHHTYYRDFLKVPVDARD
jgi:hypothetical protein